MGLCIPFLYLPINGIMGSCHRNGIPIGSLEAGNLFFAIKSKDLFLALYYCAFTARLRWINRRLLPYYICIYLMSFTWLREYWVNGFESDKCGCMKYIFIYISCQNYAQFLNVSQFLYYVYMYVYNFVL